MKDKTINQNIENTKVFFIPFFQNVENLTIIFTFFVENIFEICASKYIKPLFSIKENLKSAHIHEEEKEKPAVIEYIRNKYFKNSNEEKTEELFINMRNLKGDFKNSNKIHNIQLDRSIGFDRLKSRFKQIADFQKSKRQTLFLKQEFVKQKHEVHRELKQFSRYLVDAKHIQSEFVNNWEVFLLFCKFFAKVKKKMENIEINFKNHQNNVKTVLLMMSFLKSSLHEFSANRFQESKKSLFCVLKVKKNCLLEKSKKEAKNIIKDFFKVVFKIGFRKQKIVLFIEKCIFKSKVNFQLFAQLFEWISCLSTNKKEKIIRS